MDTFLLAQQALADLRVLLAKPDRQLSRSTLATVISLSEKGAAMIADSETSLAQLGWFVARAQEAVAGADASLLRGNR